MNYYQFHIGDFNNSTRHLTRVERSVYRDLIDLYYDKESPLTSDLSMLSRKVMATSDDEYQALLIVLSEYFTLEDDGYHHERCDKQIKEYQGYIEAKARAGKASAAKRKQKSTRVEQNDMVCATNQEPLITNHKPIKEHRVKNFTPPSLQEITDYCRERMNQVSPQRFLDFYESKGWMVGKNKMKDWKAAIRNWESRGNDNGNNTQQSQGRAARVAAKLDEIAARDIAKNGFPDKLD